MIDSELAPEEMGIIDEVRKALGLDEQTYSKIKDWLSRYQSIYLEGMAIVNG